MLAAFFVAAEFHHFITQRSLPLAIYVAAPIAVLLRIVLSAGVAEAMVRKLDVSLQAPLGRLWSSGGIVAFELVVVLTWLRSTVGR